MPYLTRRRNFLTGACALGLGYWLRRLEASAQGMPAPKRLLVIHHPVGTVRDNWVISGNSETDFELSRILAPFEPLKQYMTILDGIDIPAIGVGGGHEQGTVTMMTGVRTTELYPGNGGDDPKAADLSVDQRFLAASKSLQGPPIASLQTSCDDRVDVGEFSTRRLSYSGPAQPMDPYLVPDLTYQRVFGTMMPGGGTMAGTDALQKARMLKKSVLDFSLSDLKRLRTLAPGSEYARLDAHENAIRALETELDANPTSASSCGLSEEPDTTLQPFLDSNANRIGNGSYSTTMGTMRDDQIHEKIGNLHFSVIRAAFQCDLTRVVTFQWSPGTNHVSFVGQYPNAPDSIKMHHPVSHEPSSPDVLEFLTNIEVWYAQRTAALLQTLLDTPDMGGGTLLDNTFIPYVTEVARADHSWTGTPIVVFGGAGVKLPMGGRIKRYNPHRSLNDMWLACAQAIDAEGITTLGESEMYSGPLDILA
jgi:uncharacterized protein DUF1552